MGVERRSVVTTALLRGSRQCSRWRRGQADWCPSSAYKQLLACSRHAAGASFAERFRQPPPRHRPQHCRQWTELSARG